MKNRDYLIVMKEILQMIDEGVHVVDPEGNSVVYNRSMAMLEKMESQDVLKKPFAEVFKNVEESTLMQALEKRQTTLRKEQTYLNKDGREITTVNTTVPVMEDGRLIGAIEIAKNITDVQKMSRTILELRREMDQPQRSKEHKIKKYSFDNLYGQNEAFLGTVALAKKAARINASVVIYGETGTGKELFAQSIHFASDRQNKPFLAQNCAALPANLLESILFGTAKGGFTGAVDRAGMFEQANGGTLLLDEIDTLPLHLQPKLLRVLQEGEIIRIGGTKSIKVDVRLIAATNSNLAQAVAEGRFRQDLYYRLNVIPLDIPPLRDRTADIMPLAGHFIEKLNEKYHKYKHINYTCGPVLSGRTWPGNVRQLENLMERVYLSTDAIFITAAHLEPYLFEEMPLDPSGKSLKDIVGDYEKKYIEKVMGNYSSTQELANALQIDKSTLTRKIARYGIKNIY